MRWGGIDNKMTWGNLGEWGRRFHILITGVNKSDKKIINAWFQWFSSLFQLHKIRILNVFSNIWGVGNEEFRYVNWLQNLGEFIPNLTGSQWLYAVPMRSQRLSHIFAVESHRSRENHWITWCLNCMPVTGGGWGQGKEKTNKNVARRHSSEKKEIPVIFLIIGSCLCLTLSYK